MAREPDAPCTLANLANALWSKIALPHGPRERAKVPYGSARERLLVDELVLVLGHALEVRRLIHVKRERESPCFAHAQLS